MACASAWSLTKPLPSCRSSTPNVCSVTDDLDRRCLMSILRQYLCPRVVRQECAALTASGTYSVPKDGSLESYIDSIRALPRWVR